LIGVLSLHYGRPLLFYPVISTTDGDFGAFFSFFYDIYLAFNFQSISFLNWVGIAIFGIAIPTPQPSIVPVGRFAI
jgi:hypothetical protein